MKNLTSILLSFLIVFGLTYCGDKVPGPQKGEPGPEYEAQHMDPFVYLKSSNYERIEREALVSSGSCSEYLEGILDYKEGDEISATIEFKKERTGDSRSRAICSDHRGRRDAWARRKGGKGSRYTKVVMEPLVKVEGCDYLVAGSICFFEGDEWVATIDFGDGTCDEWATKTTKDGKNDFSLKKYKSWNP